MGEAEGKRVEMMLVSREGTESSDDRGVRRGLETVQGERVMGLVAALAERREGEVGGDDGGEGGKMVE